MEDSGLERVVSPSFFPRDPLVPSIPRVDSIPGAVGRLRRLFASSPRTKNSGRAWVALAKDPGACEGKFPTAPVLGVTMKHLH
eukprot:7733858-Prorocentrum_lima.AAC.1